MKFELAKLEERHDRSIYSDLSGSGIIMHRIKLGEGAGRWVCAVPGVVTARQRDASVHLAALKGSMLFVHDVGTYGSMWISTGAGGWMPMAPIICTGTPEAAIAAPVGSLATRTDGGASTTFYVKQSGTGNTGWVAK